MSETKTEWYFIVNPRAGSGKTMSQWVPAEKLLEQKGVPFITAMTDHKKHAVELAREAAAAGYRRIAAVGGDGSLHEVLGGICAWCEENGVPRSSAWRSCPSAPATTGSSPAACPLTWRK